MRVKKKFILIICVILALGCVGLASYAAKDASDAGTLVNVCREPQTTLDPHVNVDGTLEYLRPCYEGLVAYRVGTSQVEPCLATSWEVSVDGLVYTFTLRNGVHFDDGSLFDAAAVVKNFQRIVTMNLGAAYLISGVFDRAEAVNPQTVGIYVKKPSPGFIYSLAEIYMISPKAIAENEKNGDWATAWFHDHIDGTGPYTLEYWQPASELSLKQFDGYWGGWEGKHLQYIVVKNVAELATQRMLLQAGQIDMIDEAQTEDLPGYRADPKIKVYDGQLLTGWYITMNCLRGPTADIRVRQAIAYAFDYAAAVQQLRQGKAAQLQGPLNMTNAAHDNSLFQYHQDLDKARQLLANAGYSGGVKLELTMAVVQNLTFEIECGEVLQAALASLGVKLNVVQIAWATFLNMSQDPAKANDLAMVSTLYANDPVPDKHFDLYWRTGGTYNWSFFSSIEAGKALDAILDQAKVTMDNDLRNSLYGTAQQIIVAGCPAIFILSDYNIRVMRSVVKGFQFSPTLVFYTPFYNMYKELP
jgi:peptide/nickel transport system substrate-binding protein